MSVMWEVVAGFFLFFVYIQRNPSSCQGQLCTWANVCALLLGFMYIGTVARGCWGCWKCHPKSMIPEEQQNIVLWVFLELVLSKTVESGLFSEVENE